jgi:hypothetical protein
MTKHIIAAIILAAIMTGCSGLYNSTPEWFGKTDVGPVPIFTYKF